MQFDSLSWKLMGPKVMAKSWQWNLFHLWVLPGPTIFPTIQPKSKIPKIRISTSAGISVKMRSSGKRNKALPSCGPPKAAR